MYKMTKTTMLGLRAISRLSEKKRMSSNELATKLGASNNTLVKVLKNLAKAGILGSKRGPLGGFVLAKPLNKVTVLAVYKAVEGEPPTCCQIHQRSMKSCPLCRLVETTTRHLRATPLILLKGKLK